MAWIENYTIPFSTIPYEFHLHGFCDLQIGSTSTSLSTIKRRIDEIVKDPVDSGIIIPGDIEDEDRPSTRSIRKSAFAEREEVIYRDAEKHMAYLDKHVIPLLLPLQQTKYGIMGILAGHHWTQISPVLNSVQYMCQEIGRLSKRPVPYLGQMSSFMVITFQYRDRSIRLVGHIQHGEGGGQTKSSTITKLDRTAQGHDADFYIRAHDCQIVAFKQDRLYPKETKGGEQEIVSRITAHLNLGSATKGYELSTGSPSYVESGMLRPTAMGWGSIHFLFRCALTDEDVNRNLKCDMKVLI